LAIVRRTGETSMRSTSAPGAGRGSVPAAPRTSSEVIRGQGGQLDAEILRELPDDRCGGHGRRAASVPIPSTGDAERDERRAHRHGLAGPRVQLRDRARERRRDLDGRLRRLDLDEGLVQLDGVALGHEPRDDLSLLETLAEIGEREDPLAHQ
jgi:hypothetical protein